MSLANPLVCAVVMVATLGGASVTGVRVAAAQETVASGPATPLLGGVRGIVRDHAGRLLTGARIAVLGVAKESESDLNGAYAIDGLAHGPARLVVRRLGFTPETLSIRVSAPSTAVPAVALQRMETLMPAVIVQGRRDLKGPLAGFYTRLERGHGRFFTEEQIERTRAPRMSDLLRRIPGFGISQRKFGTSSVQVRDSWVTPMIWIDGVPMSAAEFDLDNIDPRSLAGIEVYSGSATVPIEFAGGFSRNSTGGTIILWSRHGHLPARKVADGQPTATSVIAGLLERREVFTREEVDTPAVEVESSDPAPLYPDSLYNAGLGGQVEVEFVVDHLGRPRMDTFGVVASTHPALTEAVWRTIPIREFVPARRNGVAVAQVVQLPFRFEPDRSTAARKPQE